MLISNIDYLSDTPFVALDLDVMDKNIEKVARLTKESNVKLRPHTKTHKSPEIARTQLEAGSVGITVAKLGEAEVMVEGGIQDILIAFPLIGRRKLARFSELLKKADLMVALDDFIIAKGINDVGEANNEKIPIYVDVDTGLHRMGRSPEESISTIMEISKLPYIEIRGLMSHTGHANFENTNEGRKKVAIEEATILYETKQRLKKQGVSIPEISVGATATIKYIKDIPYVTEARPGMYVFYDRGTMKNEAAQEEECALTIFATVVAHPDKERIIIDAGSKTLAREPHKDGGFGYIKGHDNLVIEKLSEEHGIVKVNGSTDLQIGDVIEIIPNHVCPVVNLTDKLYGFREGEFQRVIPVAGRGKNR